MVYAAAEVSRGRLRRKSLSCAQPRYARRAFARLQAQAKRPIQRGFAMQLAARVRAQLYRDFVDQCFVSLDDSILNVGVTSDSSYLSSNYLEALHPNKDKITACGIDDASFLQQLYPG